MVSSLNISLKYCVCKQVVGTNIMKGLLSSFSLKNISFFLVYGGLLIKISPKSFLWQGLSTVGRFFGENWSDSRVREPSEILDGHCIPVAREVALVVCAIYFPGI